MIVLTICVLFVFITHNNAADDVFNSILASPNTCPAGTVIVPGASCGGVVGAQCTEGYCVYPPGSSLGFCCKCTDDKPRTCISGAIVRRNPNNCKYDDCPVCPDGKIIVPGASCGGVVGAICPEGSCEYPPGSTLGFCCKSPCPDGSVLLDAVCGGFTPIPQHCPPGAICVFNPMSVVDAPNFCCGCDDNKPKTCISGAVVRRNPNKNCEYEDCPECPRGTIIVHGASCGGVVGAKCPEGTCVYPPGSTLGFCCKSPCPDGSVLLHDAICGGLTPIPRKCPPGAICVFNPMSVLDVPNFCCGCEDNTTKVCPGGNSVLRNPNNKCDYDECPGHECTGVCRSNDMCDDGWYCNWPKYFLVGFCCPLTCPQPKGLCLDSKDCPKRYYCNKKRGFVQGDCCKNPCFKQTPYSIGCAITEVKPPCPRRYECNEKAFGGLGACCKKCNQNDNFKTTICVKGVCVTSTCEGIKATGKKFKKKLCKKQRVKCCKTCAS